MTRISRHGRWMSAAVLLASLAACGPAYTRHGGGAPLSEQTVLRALKAVKASEEQRAKVLGAYETVRPKLEELRDQTESLRDQVKDL
jgi:hypothetical protein